MTPIEHHDFVVLPNVAEMRRDYTDVRLAFNAAASIDALAAHLYWWATENAPEAVANVQGGDNGFRVVLRAEDDNFRLTSEVALASKHARLRGDRTVRKVGQVRASLLMVDDATSFDDMRFDSDVQVVIAVPGVDSSIPEAAGYQPAAAVFERALEFLQRKMRTFGT